MLHVNTILLGSHNGDWVVRYNVKTEGYDEFKG